ncbi:MAG: iron-sulfur cluster assembly accessory protein [Spirochaetia bacterium]|nr:iron-sulfur cluster assembly accessory protein [Spirochaetota bacterium]MCX8096890.1 iron-sulfur cluster assembly accessory protein [Spirochaetota bacterium]MDW8112469.1 iron-sulfur cluster assembly accessory protein [Spirochaetia bacterium]
MITLTEAAASVIKKILEENNIKDVFLRFSVMTGGCGCSGQKYGLSIDDKKNSDDLIFETNGVKIIVDPVSYEEAKGSTIDYVKDEVFGEGFKVVNPKDQCGCGDDSCGCN